MFKRVYEGRPFPCTAAATCTIYYINSMPRQYRTTARVEMVNNNRLTERRFGGCARLLKVAPGTGMMLRRSRTIGLRSYAAQTYIVGSIFGYNLWMPCTMYLYGCNFNYTYSYIALSDIARLRSVHQLLLSHLRTTY